MQDTIAEITRRVEAAHDDILKFFREIVAIPSTDSDIEAVGARVGEEMTKLGFDQVYVDKYGSIVGRIGDGDTILLYDSHLDTVGVGDPDQWDWDPFEGQGRRRCAVCTRGARREKTARRAWSMAWRLRVTLGCSMASRCIIWATSRNGAMASAARRSVSGRTSYRISS